LKYRKIFNTSDKISLIGLGTGFGGNKARISKYNDSHIKTVQTSIDHGITFIDTAEEYGMGQAEVVIGKAINKARDKVFVSTKVSAENLNFKSVIKSAEDSLKRLNTDYIDLYQNHWLNPLIPLEETLIAMDRLIQDGKIRYVGLCNVSLDELIKVKNNLPNSSLRFVQMEYNLVDREIEQDILPFCNKENIILIAYSPLLQGKICNKDKYKILQGIATKHQKSVSQVVLNWIINNNSIIAITNTNNLNHLKENSESTDFILTKSDLEIINITFKPKYMAIPLEQIHIHDNNNDSVEICRTMQDALKNKANMIPSPKELADYIKDGKKIKPIKVKNCQKLNNKYDLIEGRLRYWAWSIANGDEPIVAINIDY